MATLPDESVRSAASDALTATLPPAWTTAPLSMNAVVECVPASLRTTTRIEPATAAPSEAPPATASSNRFSVDEADTLMSPPDETCAVLPIHAPTSLSMTSTMIETPTAALPSLRASAPATLMRCVVSVASTSIVWAEVPSGPLWLICALSAIQACVVIEKTSTMTEPVTAASPPPAPPATAIEETAGSVIFVIFGSGTIGLIDDVALTVSAAAASTTAPASMNAWVWTAGRMLTTNAPPTAVPLVDSAAATARFWSPIFWLASTSTTSVEVTCAPAPIDAVVWKVSTWMPTDAAMLASDLPPAAAMPQTMKSSSLPDGVTAWTVTPPPVTCAPAPMDAVFVMSSTLRPTPAPMATSLWRFPLKPIAREFAPV